MTCPCLCLLNGCAAWLCRCFDGDFLWMFKNALRQYEIGQTSFTGDTGFQDTLIQTKELHRGFILLLQEPRIIFDSIPMTCPPLYRWGMLLFLWQTPNECSKNDWVYEIYQTFFHVAMCFGSKTKHCSTWLQKYWVLQAPIIKNDVLAHEIG